MSASQCVPTASGRGLSECVPPSPPYGGRDALDGPGTRNRVRDALDPWTHP